MRWRDGAMLCPEFRRRAQRFSIVVGVLVSAAGDGILVIVPGTTVVKSAVWFMAVCALAGAAGLAYGLCVPLRQCRQEAGIQAGRRHG